LRLWFFGLISFDETVQYTTFIICIEKIVFNIGLLESKIVMYLSIVSGIIKHLGYDDVVEGCYDLGIFGLELELPEELLSPEKEEEREEFFERLKSNRIKIPAVTWGNMLPNEEVVKVSRMVFKSSNLETRMVKLMPPHHTKPEVSDGEYASQLTEKLNMILDQTEDIGLEITLENHGSYDRPLGVKKEFLQMVLKNVNSRRFGICLDTGCFYWYYPLDEYYTVTELFLPYITHTHLKNQTFPPDQRYKYKTGVPVQTAHDNLYEGDVDLERVIDMLKGVGYDGDLCIEDHSIGRLIKGGADIEAAREIIRNDVEFLRSII